MAMQICNRCWSTSNGNLPICAKFNSSQSNITEWRIRDNGFALPAAIGAKFGAEERTVVAVIGDGGIQMTIQEFGTIMQTGVDIKIIILNNQFLEWCASGNNYLTTKDPVCKY